MDTLKSLGCREVVLNELPAAEQQVLVNQLVDFSKQYYHIDSETDFINQVLKPSVTGSLGIFSSGNQWTGFTRLLRQTINSQSGSITAFCGSSWHNPSIKMSPLSARFALVHTLRYKLFRPHENLIYLATANTPQRFSYLKLLNPDCEPDAHGFARPEVVGLVQTLTALNDWRADKVNPMIIQQNFSLLDYPLQQQDDNPVFKQINPNFRQGHWLMVYLPLDMLTIGQCMRRSVGEMAF